MKAVALAFPVFTALALCAQFHILPTPQYAEPLAEELVLAQPVKIEAAQSNVAIAADILRGGCPQIRFGDGSGGIVLWDFSLDRKPEVEVNFLDRQLLEESPLRS